MRLRRLARRDAPLAAPANSFRRNLQEDGRNALVARSGADPFRTERRLRWRDHFSLSENVLMVQHMHAEHDGLRIAQLSDVHVGQATSALRIRRAVEAVNEEKPDPVFLTGDYVTHSPKPLPRVRELLAGIEGPSTWCWATMTTG